MGNDIDGKKVNEKFGPPSYLETLLEDIATKKGKIVEGLTSFLTLPYVNALKVKDRTGKDVSLYDQVLSLKKKYEDLQERSIPIVKQISAYGRLSQSLLPVIGKQGQLTLDTFLQINTGLVMRYGQQAKSIAKETNDLKLEFTDLLELLETNLGEVVKKIAEQENALHEAEKDYAFEKANAIISGVITICFLIGAGVALCMGAVPVAVELGVHAGIALYETIKDAIKASDLAGVIANLKSGIESAKKTKTQLESLIPKFTEIVNMFSEIGKAWDSMSEGLSEVKDDYLAWSNPKLFTPEMLAMALQSWEKVISAVDIYIRVIHGVQPAPTVYMRTLITGRIENSAKLDAEPQRQETKVMALAANLALQDTRRKLCRDIFSAPLVKGTFPQPSDLQNVANDYARAADALRQAGCGDIAMQCEGIKQAVSNSVVPSQNDALASLRIFAEKQPDVPPIPLQQSEWERFCAVRMEAVKDGRAKTDLCYKSIHDVQNSTSNLHDNLTARISELHIIMNNLENQIRQAEEDKVRALQNPFGAIGQLIQELVERLKGMYQERGRRYEEMNYVQSSTQRAEYCLQQVTSLGNATATVDSMWNSMQTQMITAADVWPVLHEVKLSDLEIDLYESTWNAVRNALGN